MTVLSDIRTLVRRDLKDEDAQAYRWTNDEIDRAIARALEELSLAIPREMKSTVATTSGSAAISLSAVSGIANLISVDRVEFPIDSMPREYRRFTLYLETTITLIDGQQGDGENCYVYWSSLHTLDGSVCTLQARFFSLLTAGAAAYAALSLAQYSSDRANTGGENVDRDYTFWGRDRLAWFKDGLRLHGRRSKLRQSRLYPETDHKGSDYE